VNEYLVGRIISDAKTLTSQLEYYTQFQIKTGKKLDTEVYKDLTDKLSETAENLQKEITHES